MTYTAHDTEAIYDAILAHLISETGRDIGDAKRPDDSTTPYAVLYPGPAVNLEGGLNNPTQVRDGEFTVTSVGRDRSEATWMQTKVKEALLGWTPTIAGVGAYPIQLSYDAEVRRDPDPQKTLFFAPDRFVAGISA